MECGVVAGPDWYIVRMVLCYNTYVHCTLPQNAGQTATTLRGEREREVQCRESVASILILLPVAVAPSKGENNLVLFVRWRRKSDFSSLPKKRRNALFSMMSGKTKQL